MITGETEHLVNGHHADDEYDNFIFRRRRKRRSRAAVEALRNKRRSARIRRRNQRSNIRIARRTAIKPRRRRIISKIRRVAPTILSTPKIPITSPVSTSPYVADTISYSPTRNSIVDTNSSIAKPEETTKTPIGWYILGGVVVTGVIGAIVIQSRKPTYPGV
ncbi:hypothetical protein [Aquimarina agarilytica]|uniref:hypothetical protein n=1 Tax=Aquimarina agarilytica TaxID=1087449 RepID=UPI000288F726|nr:hypothetical protein [Aquimarina agarilytica]